MDPLHQIAQCRGERDEWRYKVLWINPRMLFAFSFILKPQDDQTPYYRTVIDNLPSDAEVLSIGHADMPSRIGLLLWSSTFEPVPDGEMAPVFIAEYRNVELRKVHDVGQS